MKNGTRYTEEQITCILREVENGISVTEVSRKHSVSKRTVYPGATPGGEVT